MKKTILIAVFLLTSANVQAQSLTDQINAVDAVQEQQERAAAAQAQQRHAAALADKKRNQDYEDQLRAMDVQKKQLQVDMDKARVARANDYIDQELKAKSAETDVVKSQADANRDLSSGTKTLLEDTGEAEIKSQSGIFK